MSRKRLILVVDDDPRVRATATEMFRELGFDVLDAYSGGIALELLEANPSVDCMFIDIRMPGMSGTELARIARARHPHIKAVLTSGYHIEEQLELPMIAKPWLKEELRAAINEATGRP